MKIAYVIPTFLPNVGGAEVIAYETAKRLAERGHEVDVYTSKTYFSKDLGKRLEVMDGVNVFRYPNVFECGYFIRYWGRDFLRQLASGDYDLVAPYSFGHINSILALRYAHKAGIKHVMHSIIDLPPRSFFARHAKNFYNWVSFKVTLRYNERFTTFTDFEKEWLVARGADVGDVALLPPGIPDMAYDKYSKEEDFVLYVGRIHKTKGLQYLVRVMKGLDTRLVIAGPDSGFKAELEGIISREGISNVEFVGPVFGKDKYDLISRCKVFVLPTSFEAFGIVLLEAMAQSKAIVTTHAGAVPYWVGDEAKVVEYGDVAGLRGAIEILLKDDKLREKMGRLGRKKAAGYKWDAIIDKTLEVYGSL
ncbi:MAG: glycosyltransferase family 4 protein [archaeon]